MTRKSPRPWRSAALLGALLAAPATSTGQDAPRDLADPPALGNADGAPESRLGPSPGALQPSTFGTPAPGVVTGRRRGLVRVPRSAARKHHPGDAGQSAGRLALSLPLGGGAQPTPRGGAASGPSPLPGLVEDEGPADGLTLDEAIARMMAANLDLSALKFELPQAQADVLTAGLRANPVLYMDTQFIPYGSFTGNRPGGPTQYDLNLALPLDLSGKRKARVRAACAAKRVLEAQYQDVARKQIGNLYRAFVDLQAARVNRLAAAAALRELESTAARPDGADLEAPLDKARGALGDADDALGDAREAVALLLNLPPEAAEALEPRGPLRDRSALPPPLDGLTAVALGHRPDLAAARLGLGRAEAEVDLARANRLDDVYFFYDPISYQDNRPQKLASARSWDLGLAVPLPVFNRNQGNIARARHNVSQTQAEHAALARRVVSEVRQAHREYHSSRQALERLEATTLPHARAARARAAAGLAAGTLPLSEYLEQLDQDGDTARDYRDAVLRHRRAMLDLNTAVALRIMP